MRADVPVPLLLRDGMQMTKVTSKRHKRFDPDTCQIV